MTSQRNYIQYNLTKKIVQKRDAKTQTRGYKTIEDPKGELAKIGKEREKK